MPFSNEWEQKYKQKKHFSIYPWNDIIKLVNWFVPVNKKIKVLELGCGVGANIPFFLDKNFDYYAVEGSKSAVNYILKKYKNVNIKCLDFTKKLPYPDNFFDLVVDRGSITHNKKQDINNVVENVKRILKKESLFIISDWFCTEHGMYKLGEQLESHSRYKYKSGMVEGVGIVHFFDEKELKTIFKNWKFLFLEKKINEIYYNTKISENNKVKNIEVSWNIVLKNI